MGTTRDTIYSIYTILALVGALISISIAEGFAKGFVEGYAQTSGEYIPEMEGLIYGLIFYGAIWSVLSLIPAVIGWRYKRGYFRWYFLSYLITPLITTVIVLVLGNKDNAVNGYSKSNPIIINNINLGGQPLNSPYQNPNRETYTDVIPIDETSEFDEYRKQREFEEKVRRANERAEKYKPS
jgi:hypothetical protein